MNDEAETSIKVEGRDCKVLYRFPVLWESWECDSEGWIVEDSGQPKLVFTNHGSAYFASEDALTERMFCYHAALLKSAEALEMIRSTDKTNGNNQIL